MVRRLRRRRRRTSRVPTPAPGRHGGARPGAGRKPRGKRARVPHRRRGRLSPRFPVHVTIRLRTGLPTLRRTAPFTVVQRSLAAGKERFGFRLVHYTAMSNHLHLLVEAKNQRSLSRGMQGLTIRLAKALNRLWKRRGSVFADRYHAHILRSPREVRAALAYVLRNATRHGVKGAGPDPYSSGGSFDGWRGAWVAVEKAIGSPDVARARSWLLRTGWRRHMAIAIEEVPRGG